MKTVSLAFLAAVLGLELASVSVSAEELSPSPALKQITVRSAAQVKGAFNLAARDGGRQAIEISCSPANSDWCAKDFVQACDNAKGGMSTNPDGGVTCSLPHYK